MKKLLLLMIVILSFAGIGYAANAIPSFANNDRITVTDNAGIVQTNQQAYLNLTGLRLATNSCQEMRIVTSVGNNTIEYFVNDTTGQALPGGSQYCGTVLEFNTTGSTQLFDVYYNLTGASATIFNMSLGNMDDFEDTRSNISFRSNATFPFEILKALNWRTPSHIDGRNSCNQGGCAVNSSRFFFSDPAGGDSEISLLTANNVSGSQSFFYRMKIEFQGSTGLPAWNLVNHTDIRTRVCGSGGGTFDDTDFTLSTGLNYSIVMNSTVLGNGNSSVSVFLGHQNSSGITVMNTTSEENWECRTGSYQMFFQSDGGDGEIWEVDFFTSPRATLTQSKSAETGFNQCNAPVGNEVVVYNFTFRDEMNYTLLADVDFEATFRITNLSNLSLDINASFNINDVSTVSFCRDPASQDQVNATIQYSKDGFDFRNYYFVNNSITNTTQNIRLFLLQDDFSTAITLVVNDELNNPFIDAVVQIQKFFIVNNTFEIVAMGRSDSDGQDVVFLQQNDPFYKFVIIRGEVIQFQSTKKRVTTDQLQFNVLPDTIQETLTKFGSVAFNFTNNTLADGSLSFNVTWNDLSGGVNNFCLRVDKLTPINETNICEVCDTASTASLGCSFALQNATFKAVFWGTVNPNELFSTKYQIIIHEFFKDKIGLDGLIFSFIIIGTITAVGIATPPVALVLLMIGLFVVWQMGFMELGAFGITAFMSIMSAIIILVVMTRRKGT